MASFYVNGQLVTAEKNQKLLRFLRDELRLTSVKDGCSEGACGTCHVLIDGKATKACVPSVDKLEGRHLPRPVRCSAASVFRAWSFLPRRCWM